MRAAMLGRVALGGRGAGLAAVARTRSGVSAAAAAPAQVVLLQRRGMVGRSKNKAGFDKVQYEEYPEEGKVYLEVSMEEVVAAIAERKKKLEEQHIEFIKNWKPLDIPDDSPWEAVDWESHLVQTSLDFEDLPENLKGVKCTWEYYVYPPYYGVDKDYEKRERPHRTVTVHVPVDQFGWTDTQFDRFKKIVSTRYNPNEREFVLTSSNLEETADNFARVKQMLSTLLDEVKSVS
jgi:hypothetical protein